VDKEELRKFRQKIQGKFNVKVTKSFTFGCETDPFKVPVKYILRFKPVEGCEGSTHRAKFGEFFMEINIKDKKEIKHLIDHCELILN
jgi:hypothetical protein